MKTRIASMVIVLGLGFIACGDDTAGGEPGGPDACNAVRAADDSGRLCGGFDDCRAIPCVCAAGVVETRTCHNGLCLGAEVCSDACLSAGAGGNQCIAADDSGTRAPIDAGSGERDAGSHGDAGVCTPSCADRECGGDGCGGSCGVCGAGASCEAGQCIRPSPDGVSCLDRTCGVGEQCCGIFLDSSAIGSGECVRAGSSCSSDIVACDGHNDCGAGEVCCVELLGAAGWRATCAAADTCTSGTRGRACNTSVDCPGVFDQCCSARGFPVDRCFPGGCV